MSHARPGNLWIWPLMVLNCGAGEDSWESVGLQGDPTSPSWRRSVLGVHWKDWCWSWNSNTLATSCEELTHLKRPWCWEGLGAGGEGDDRGWDGWMASPTPWTWVWVNSGSLWWTGRPGVLWFMGSQRVYTTEQLNWTELLEEGHGEDVTTHWPSSCTRAIRASSPLPHPWNVCSAHCSHQGSVFSGRLRWESNVLLRPPGLDRPPQWEAGILEGRVNPANGS